MKPVAKRMWIMAFKVLFAAGMLLFIYGSYLVVKPLSYKIFYRDNGQGDSEGDGEAGIAAGGYAGFVMRRDVLGFCV